MALGVPRVRPQLPDMPALQQGCVAAADPHLLRRGGAVQGGLGRSGWLGGPCGGAVGPLAVAVLVVVLLLGPLLRGGYYAAWPPPRPLHPPAAGLHHGQFSKVTHVRYRAFAHECIVCCSSEAHEGAAHQYTGE